MQHVADEFIFIITGKYLQYINNKLSVPNLLLLTIYETYYWYNLSDRRTCFAIGYQILMQTLHSQGFLPPCQRKVRSKFI